MRLRYRSSFLVSLSAALLAVAAGVQAQRETAGMPGAGPSSVAAALTEKVFVHTDKPVYLTGEILWFRVYVVDGSSLKPLTVSKVGYVEILSAEHRAVLQAKVGLQAGAGEGSFLLPLSLTSGVYRIRAYTSWMKNGNADKFFEADLLLINPLKPRETPATEVPAAVGASFFPEGGTLVDGIPTTVGIQVMDGDRKGLVAGAILTDGDGHRIDSFRTSTAGLGRFSFTPDRENRYQVHGVVADGRTFAADLPPVAAGGYGLHAGPPADGHITVLLRQRSPSADPQALLVLRNRGRVRWTAQVIFQAGQAVNLDIPATDNGVSRLTLYDSRGTVVAERALFSRPRPWGILAGSDRDAYETRSEVSVSVALPPSDTTTDPGADLSLSVYRLDSLVPAPLGDIGTYLLGDSECDGYPGASGGAFADSSRSGIAAADDLMLTAGYRMPGAAGTTGRESGDATSYAPEFDGHLLQGSVTDKLSGRPVPDLLVYAAAPGKQFRLGTAITDTAGKFRIDIAGFTGFTELVVQTENRADSNFRIDVLSPFSDKTGTRPFPPFRLRTGQEEDLRLHSLATQVQDAYRLEDMNHFTALAPADSTAFFGTADNTYLLDDYTRFNSMEEVIREYISGVVVKKQHNHFHFRVIDAPRKEFFDAEPLMLVDGVPVRDADRIMTIDPLKIRKIEVVTRKYYLGALQAPGIISLSSYNGDLEGFDYDAASLVLDYEGLQLTRDFYAPRYAAGKTAPGRIPDFRTQLAWKTGLHPAAGKPALIHFFTSDRKGKYLVQVQGVDGRGRAGSTSFTFDVR